MQACACDQELEKLRWMRWKILVLFYSVVIFLVCFRWLFAVERQHHQGHHERSKAAVYQPSNGPYLDPGDIASPSLSLSLSHGGGGRPRSLQQPGGSAMGNRSPDTLRTQPSPTPTGISLSLSLSVRACVFE